ncbi:MAG: hypothetical protein N2446_02525 [Elusimicrobiales bacterium]|nr:hypothetical protein [Elusimicrobiales bacterium]
MKKRISLLIFLFISNSNNIYAVRPLISEDPPVVGNNIFSIESGVIYDDKDFSLDITLIYGLTEKMEIAAKGNYLDENFNFLSGIHFKYEFAFFTFKSEYLKNLKISESFFSLSFSKYFYKSNNFSIFSNIGFLKNNDENFIFYSLASSYNYMRNKIFYTDLFFEVNDSNFSIFRKHILKPLIGLNYLITENFILDLGYMVELNEFRKERDNYILGFTLNF